MFMNTYFDLAPCKELFETIPSLIAPQQVQPKVHSEFPLMVHLKEDFNRGYILHRNKPFIYIFHQSSVS